MTDLLEHADRVRRLSKDPRAGSTDISYLGDDISLDEIARIVDDEMAEEVYLNPTQRAKIARRIGIAPEQLTMLLGRPVRIKVIDR